ncbi:uncharacterized protein EAF02_002113 [Botrytis sinoallii]|uniref:uncharacterized protein n=1 Tax=Botrytis sinoallii TaxID=1463999 RepID=UPI001900E8AA|nr:uncharacterized protein EAF02_002113 [Botrytis sinoallii]KAF7889698.1 hypothetical protein EAF02_002113 [Botrytis sinoallii]
MPVWQTYPRGIQYHHQTTRLAIIKLPGVTEVRLVNPCFPFLSNNIPGLNGSDADGSGYFFSASWVHNASNTTFYEKVVAKVWPNLIVQRNEAHGIQTARLSCLKANATKVERKTIGGVPNVATRFQLYGWVVMAVVSAVGLLLL